jgi:hypothetical protein
MTATQTGSSPALYSGPFNTLHSLGIDRGNYIAVHANNPAAAAQYAEENMGFYLVHVDSGGRHYLAAHGLDAYSLVYTPGEQGRLDHISYVVRSADDLLAAEKRLTDLGLKSERIERSQLWRHGPALRFTSPTSRLYVVAARSCPNPTGGGEHLSFTAQARKVSDSRCFRLRRRWAW